LDSSGKADLGVKGHGLRLPQLARTSISSSAWLFLVSDAVGNVKTRLSPNPKCNEPDESKQRSDEWNDQDEAALCRPVVNPVIRRLPRVRQPTPSPRCLKAQAMANNTFPRCSRRNPFSERWPSESESHLLTSSRLHAVSLRQASRRNVSFDFTCLPPV
jgi:hypothetical protein